MFGMSADTFYPTRPLWSRIFPRQEEKLSEPLIPEFQDVPKPPPSFNKEALHRPNRDADFHRVPDPDFFEPPDEFER